MVFAAAFHGAGEGIVEETPVVVEPAFGLDEAEEEEAGDVEQGEVGAFGWRDACGGGAEGGGVGEVSDDLLEGAVEASCEGIAAQRVEPCGVGEDVAVASGGSERGYCFCVAGDDVGAVDVQGDDARFCSIG